MSVANNPARSRSAPKRRRRPSVGRSTTSRRRPNPLLIAIGLVIATGVLWWFHSQYTVSLQSPVVIQLRWPVVIAERIRSDGAERAQADQHGHRLSAWQEYACQKFGNDCRVALAIQRAENPQGKCEIYHYNSDGTLDWGYFQINTVHLKRPGLNLRDLLDCKANIDFAYQLFQEQGGFTPWSTYNSGLYKRFIGPE
ncbi:MAG TPA: hypothetical protein VHW24_15750 [Bryobacteraceae bacterium]|nr:hypothetical protein [Bryobacteraceae bacterium]